MIPDIERTFDITPTIDQWSRVATIQDLMNLVRGDLALSPADRMTKRDAVARDTRRRRVRLLGGVAAWLAVTVALGMWNVAAAEVWMLASLLAGLIALAPEVRRLHKAKVASRIRRKQPF